MKIVVVMPAYNAEKTLKQTYYDIPKDIVNEIILVDDASHDETIKVAKSLGIKVFTHPKNLGYGANQKTCYKEALKLNPDIVVMLHPDYQYDPKLIPSLVQPIIEGKADLVLGSRLLNLNPVANGMPVYKYISNRFLTFLENIILNQNLSEFHTGFRAYSRRLLENIRLEENSNDFVFDQELIVQAVALKYKIAEIPCPAKYFKEASSINFIRSVKYGIDILILLVKYILHKLKIKKFTQFLSK
jgi:glycosyltransferase involved in cell wall biosynthesis